MQLTRDIMPKISDKSIDLFNISFSNNICSPKYVKTVFKRECGREDSGMKWLKMFLDNRKLAILAQNSTISTFKTPYEVDWTEGQLFPITRVIYSELLQGFYRKRSVKFESVLFPLHCTINVFTFLRQAIP